MVELQIEESLEVLTHVAPLHIPLPGGLRRWARTNRYHHRLDNEGVGPSFVHRLRTGPDVIDSATAPLKPTAIVDHVNARRVIIAGFGFFIQTRIDAVDAPEPMQDWRLGESISRFSTRPEALVSQWARSAVRLPICANLY
jgi:hypothetical protein